ncbi:hypothetical protein [Amycolatopsis orientalis]|uniref:hypothetical protein n=1 Tax=Amycolatopsis orientalis TaxID=31958 RepID=UPI0003A900D9|nr:hypothetical protein [Amycolatopsis orientalis]
MGNDANTVGKELKYAAGGAVAGAAVGSVVPVIGTAVGAAGGALVGSLVGLFSGGPDAKLAEADLGGRSIDARTIWEKIHVGDSSSLQTGVSAANNLKTVHNDRVTEIDNLNKKMDAAWQGGGATAAQAGAHPLGVWLQDSVNNLGKSHTYLNTQVDCFSTVKSKVQEIAKDPPHAGFVDGINPFSDKDDEINQYNETGKANVQAYTNYFNASGQNASQLPQYSAWQGNNISNPGGGPGDFGGGPGGSGGNFGGGPGGGGGGFTPPKMDPPKFTPTNPPGTPPHTTFPGGPSGPGGPGHGGVTDPTGHYPGSGNDGVTTSGWTPPTTDPSKFSPSAFGPGGGAGQFGPGGGGGAGSGAGAAFGPGAFGAGAGFGPGGSGSGAAAGGMAGGAGAGGMGSGMRGGAAGKPGAAGMGGMGAGAKGGKGQEDEEHQTKYLVEEDSNELFGSDQLTVPPVIGE